MKRSVLIRISLVLIILVSGVYLLIDFLFFHKVFKEEIKPGSCLILQEKYCRNGVIVKNPFDDDDIAIAFNLPLGTPIFAPISGDFVPFVTVIGEDNKLPTFLFKNKNNNLTTEFIIFSELDQQQMINGSIVVEQGSIVNTIKANYLSFFTKYNLVITIGKTDENGKISNVDIMKKLFSKK